MLLVFLYICSRAVHHNFVKITSDSQENDGARGRMPLILFEVVLDCPEAGQREHGKLKSVQCQVLISNMTSKDPFPPQEQLGKQFQLILDKKGFPYSPLNKI
jgi:hypothetical protein